MTNLPGSPVSNADRASFFARSLFPRHVSGNVDSVLTTSHSLLIDSRAASAILGPIDGVSIFRTSTTD